ncbi:MAG: hypothetical protein NWF01_03375 [Candidatus Bathyarchaeota archaeon]|nr:hypothetical protein [Candidatus Bathyarchaeota archaeon]
MVDGIFDHLTCKPQLTIKASDDENYINLDTIFDDDGTNKLTLNISRCIRLPTQTPTISPNDLVYHYIWEWKNGLWKPHTYTIPTGENYIRFKDTDSGHYGDLSLIKMSGTNNPILTWSQGFIVKKDFAVGGYISSNQGMLGLGSGMYDPFHQPMIWLMHSELSALHDINDFPSATPEDGELYINTGEAMIYKYNETAAEWQEFAPTSEYNYNLDTLHIYRLNQTDLGNLKCANIYAEGLGIIGTDYGINQLGDFAAHTVNIYAGLVGETKTWGTLTAGLEDTAPYISTAALRTDSLKKLDGSTFPFQIRVGAPASPVDGDIWLT